MRKQLTGEPVAGELHTGFGGRGRRQPFPTPIHWPIAPCRTATEQSSNYADSVPPESLEPTRGEVVVPYGMSDVLVPEVMPDCIDGAALSIGLKPRGSVSVAPSPHF